MFSHYQQTGRWQRDQLYERLAKPGNEYSIYSNKHYEGEILLQAYQVEQIFQDKDSGFYALGLVATNPKNPPVLVIRGFGNWGSLEDFPTEFLPYKDLPDVIVTQSTHHLQAAKKVGVVEWLRNKASVGEKPDLVGQSLGGKIGQQLTIEAQDSVHALVTFNSIGISLQEFQAYQGNVEIIHYINPIDFVPYVLGDKFLPGIIFQVHNPTIRSHNFLGQHNNIVLDKLETLVQEVEIEVFYWVRELYHSLKTYRITVQNEIEELHQLAKQEATSYGNSINQYTQAIRQQFDLSLQAVQQEFGCITQAIRQQLLAITDRQDTAQLLQQRVSSSVEVIQQEIERLSVTVQPDVKDSRRTFKGFSQTLKQELQDSVGMIQHKLENLRQVETKANYSEPKQ